MNKMDALKIIFITNEKQVVLYGQGMRHMWQVDTYVLERLGEVERQSMSNATFRKYWIDEENDRVEIINDVDFEFFLKNQGNKIPKIYFEALTPREGKTPAEAQSTTSFSSNVGPEESLSVHPTVECDACLQAPIRGFRYKCMQCPNFDLCMKCEAAMKHPEHMMLRIPVANSTKLENICPMSGHFSKTLRRQQKLAARAAAAANAAALGAELEIGKPRHHRHHRKQCSGGTGLFANFYDMMQDLAEGGVAQKEGTPEATPQKASMNQDQQQDASAPPPSAPSPSPPQPGVPIEAVIASVKAAADAAAREAREAASAAASAAATATAAASASATACSTATSATNISRETNTSPDRRSSTSSSVGGQTPLNHQGIPMSPSLESIIDPHFMKAGIQILNNFSEMFNKILDPVVTEGSTRASSAGPETSKTDLTSGNDNATAATPPPTAVETPKQASNVASGMVTPMETETLAQNGTLETPPAHSRSQSEENDWTMIDSEASTSTKTDPSVPQQPIDFLKLSQQLQSHIESEMSSASVSIDSPSPIPSATPSQTLILNEMSNSTPADAPSTSTAPAAAPTPGPSQAPAAAAAASAAPAASPAPEQTEKRAVAVFHADPRINSAIHGMMAMGFSNEGAVLTQLLESVNGSIPLALDLMTAAQRN